MMRERSHIIMAVSWSYFLFVRLWQRDLYDYFSTNQIFTQMSSNVHELITTVTNVFIAEMTDEARKAQFADVMVD